MKNRIFTAFVVVGLAGCQSFHYYDGPERPRAETAELYVAAYNDLGLSVLSVNDKFDGSSYKKRLYLLPGEYSLTVRTGRYVFVRDGKDSFAEGIFAFKFDAKAGKTYMFRSTHKGLRTLDGTARACIYEEDQNSPSRDVAWTNEFREPSKDAKLIACSGVKMRPA